MATYTNPSSLLTPTDFKLTGTAAGAMSSIKDAYAFSDMDAANRDQDLGYLATLNRYQNQMADNPLLEKQRQLGMSAVDMQQQGFDTGQTQRTYVAGQKMEEAASNAKSAVSDLQRSIAGATAHHEANEWLKSIEGSGYGELASLDNPEMKKTYASFQERAKAAGTPLPDNPFNPSNREMIASRANAAIRSLPHMQQMELMMSKQEVQSSMTDKKIAAQKEIAEGNRTSRESINLWKMESSRTTEEAITKLVDKEGPYTPEDVVALKHYASIQFDKTWQGKNPVDAFYTEDLAPERKAAEAAGIDPVRSPNQWYQFAREKYVDRVTKPVIAVHGVKGEQQQGQPPATQQQGAATQTPVASLPEQRRFASGTIKGLTPSTDTGAYANASTTQGAGSGTEKDPYSFDLYKSGRVPKGQFYRAPDGSIRIKQ